MDERIAVLENLTLQTMTTTGKLEVTEVMADVVNLWCRVENTNKSFPDWSKEQLEQNDEIAEKIKDFDELIWKEHLDVYGNLDSEKFSKKPSHTIPVTIWYQDVENEGLHMWKVMTYRHPLTGSTKVTAEWCDVHGFLYLVKIL
ncbi:MAG: hypothetical protein ACO3NL_00110 [Phycisphaerales bacterium]